MCNAFFILKILTTKYIPVMWVEGEHLLQQVKGLRVRVRVQTVPGNLDNANVKVQVRDMVKPKDMVMDILIGTFT